jgi:fatty-acyl-CoA synthase
MCGAPITMITMLSYPDRIKFSHEVKMLTGGAPPPPSLMARFTAETGVSIRTSYGLTESYGPATFHLPDPQWDGKASADAMVAAAVGAGLQCINTRQ